MYGFRAWAYSCIPFLNSYNSRPLKQQAFFSSERTKPDSSRFLGEILGETQPHTYKETGFLGPAVRRSRSKCRSIWQL